MLSRYFCLLILTSLVACSAEPIYYSSLPAQDLSYQDTLIYEVELLAEVPVTLTLEINHQMDYNFENLYLQSIYTLPDNTVRKDTFSVQLASSGQWLGQCHSSCLLNYVLEEELKSSVSGTASLAFLQHSRQEVLSGINAIGLIVSDK